MTETDMLLQCQIQNGRADGPALGDEGQIANIGHFGCETGVEISARPDDAQTVRSHDTKSACISHGPDLLLDFSSFFADLFPSGRDDDGAGHLLFHALPHDLRDGNNRRGDDHQVHPRFQIRYGFNSRQAMNGFVFWVYRQQHSFIAAIDEVFHQHIADTARFFAGARHRHPARLEDTIQIILTHVTVAPYFCWDDPSFQDQTLMILSESVPCMSRVDSSSITITFASFSTIPARVRKRIGRYLYPGKG